MDDNNDIRQLQFKIYDIDLEKIRLRRVEKETGKSTYSEITYCDSLIRDIMHHIDIIEKSQAK